MTKLSTPEKALLFLNNQVGDDLWEKSHLLLSGYKKFETPQEFFPYKAPEKNNRPSRGLHIISFPYELRSFSRVQLYGFPFLPFYVDPLDLEYTLPIQGLVITEDMRMFDYFLEQDEDFFNIVDPHNSHLAWAKEQNIPTLLAVHHAGAHDGDDDKLKRLVGMELFCPVLWHPGDINANFLHHCVETMITKITQY